MTFGCGKLILDGAGGYFLAFALGAGVVVGLADGGVAGFLTPGDVDAAEGVWTEPGEVATGGRRSRGLDYTEV